MLRDYFCDKDAQAVQTQEGWSLTLQWPDGADRHVDPQLPQGLAWWGDAVARSTMVLAQRRAGRVLTCLYDTLTLHSWSRWLARRSGNPLTEPVILHVDDHRDLASPRLFVNGSGLLDPLTGNSVDIAEPQSTERAIASGAIGMGSFLTPFLHAVPGAEVRHLCQPPKIVGTIDHKISLVTEADTLLQPGARRPAVRLEIGDRSGPGCYRITPNVGAWLDGIGLGPILLHIDMDYFNNRYDGDSRWTDRQDVLDPPLTVILDKIDEMTSALRSSACYGRIEDVVVAYSPGFFPAEFWREADARLRSGLDALYAR